MTDIDCTHPAYQDFNQEVLDFYDTVSNYYETLTARKIIPGLINHTTDILRALEAAEAELAIAQAKFDEVDQTKKTWGASLVTPTIIVPIGFAVAAIILHFKETPQ